MAQPARKPEPPSLDQEIERIRALANELIEKEVAALKQSPSGAALPIDWLRKDLIKGRCPCDCALRLLEKK
jgi:hypothetical protein